MKIKQLMEQQEKDMLDWWKSLSREQRKRIILETYMNSEVKREDESFWDGHPNERGYMY